MGPLADDVARVGRALAPRLRPLTADAVAAITARASAAPTLVVTGPVSSGKSTLVNALVGRRVAPTGAGECTRLVARYVRGPVDRLDVVLIDGSRRPLPLAEGGRVPAAVGDRLGVDPADVDHLLVTLTSDALEGLTVVDTPGTGSARRGGTETGGDEPGATAGEAALVVLPATAREAELAELTGAGGTAGPTAAGPTGVVTVLGRADTVEDPGTTADALGHRLGGRLGPVLPVVGLLAETAVTGALRTEDVHTLGALARLDPAAREELLLRHGADVRDPDDGSVVDPSAADPCAPDPTAPDPPAPDPTALDRLHDLLDRRGIDLAVTTLRRDPDAGVGEICAVLLAASGLDRLVARLADEVRGRADLLAATAAERRLAALAARSPDPDAALLADAVAELRTAPGRIEADLLAARARVRAGTLSVPEDLADELARLTEPGPPGHRLGLDDQAPAELAGHAARRAAAWRSYASWGSPRERGEVAHVVHRAYVRLWRELTT